MVGILPSERRALGAGIDTAEAIQRMKDGHAALSTDRDLNAGSECAIMDPDDILELARLREELAILRADFYALCDALRRGNLMIVRRIEEHGKED